VRERLASFLNELSFGRVLTEQELHRYGIDFDQDDKRKFGELFFLVDPGVYIFPNYLHCIYRNHVKAAHGYDPSDEASYGVFMYSGPMVDKLNRVAELRVIDILPTILDLLDIGIPSSCEGSSALS